MMPALIRLRIDCWGDPPRRESFDLQALPQRGQASRSLATTAIDGCFYPVKQPVNSATVFAKTPAACLCSVMELRFTEHVKQLPDAEVIAEPQSRGGWFCNMIAHCEGQRQHGDAKFYGSGYCEASFDRWAPQLAASKCATEPQEAVSDPPTGGFKNGGIMSDIFVSAGAQLLALGVTQSLAKKFLA